jgi:hypothetical protein
LKVKDLAAVCSHEIMVTKIYLNILQRLSKDIFANNQNPEKNILQQAIPQCMTCERVK